MTKERRALFVGILAGALLAGAVAVGVVLRLQQGTTPAVETTASGGSGEAGVTVGTAPAAGGPSAVQLSPDEQSKIGLQTTEVRRESLTEEIGAIGRVEEPE